LFPALEPVTAAAEDAEAGTNPTLYVPNPMIGWGVPSRSGIVGHARRVCFCCGDHDDGIDVDDIIMGFAVLDDDDDGVKREFIKPARDEWLIKMGWGVADVVVAVAERSSGSVLVRIVMVLLGCFCVACPISSVCRDYQLERAGTFQTFPLR
jgi:hypothetical protein